jgi:hypothetical protein
MTLSGQLCWQSVTGTESSGLRFRTTREIDLTVTGPDGTEVWWAGEGIRYGSPGPDVLLRNQTCLDWWSTWNGRDRGGRVVAAGTYGVHFDVQTNFAGDNGVFTQLQLN